MRRMRSWGRPASTGARTADAGMTLVEMVVSMVLLSMFMALCSTTLISVVRTVRKQNGVIDAQTSTRTAFLQLDKQIRYADAVTAPGTVAGDQWIEWRVPDPTIPITQSVSQSRCYQWRASASTGLLQYRSWILPTSGGGTPTTWRLVATGLVLGAQPVFTITPAGLQAAPFGLPVAGSAYGLSRMQVGVALTVNINDPPGRSVVSTVFTALNSSSTPATVCSEVPRT